jgi:hypothetical protein
MVILSQQQFNDIVGLLVVCVWVIVAALILGGR